MRNRSQWRDESLHHIVGRKNHTTFNVENPENKIIIGKKKHEALNTFFEERQSPREQLQAILNMASPVFRKERKEKLQALLDAPNHEVYTQRMLKYKK